MGCWNYTGSRNGKGYGQAKIDGRWTVVHRAAYEVLVGPIQPGLQLDHLCRNTSCYNPAHLEPVTQSENLKRGARARGAAAAEHGRSAYRYGCRCDVCRSAEATYRRAYRNRAS